MLSLGSWRCFLKSRKSFTNLVCWTKTAFLLSWVCSNKFTTKKASVSKQASFLFAQKAQSAGAKYPVDASASIILYKICQNNHSKSYFWHILLYYVYICRQVFLVYFNFSRPTQCWNLKMSTKNIVIFLKNSEIYQNIMYNRK